MTSATSLLERLGSSQRKSFLGEVLAGLAARPRLISPRWLYDRRGSELFEEITQLPEYYVTRAERQILRDNAGSIAHLAGPGRAVVEFGSGSSSKTPVLLQAAKPSAYVPIDISSDFLHESVAHLRTHFPALPLYPIAADFTRPIALPTALKAAPRLGFFAGSTIGNMSVPEAVEFLGATRMTLGESALLLIGIDRVKDLRRLICAYDDKQGVTAKFNLNLLTRINRELRGTIPVDRFSHLVRWNDLESRIEMHLQARTDLQFCVEGQSFSMVAGETIHTESSMKYGPRDARVLLKAGGWHPFAEWTDPDGLFAVFLARGSGSVSSLHSLPTFHFNDN
jgi:L-histidine Nalpha-methyltransferase